MKKIVQERLFVKRIWPNKLQTAANQYCFLATSSSLLKKKILSKLIRYKYGTFTAIYGCLQKNTFDMKRLLCYWRSAVCVFKTENAMQMNSTKINSSVKRYQIAMIGNSPDPLSILAITVARNTAK